MTEVNDMMFEKSVEFLKKPKKFLKHLVKQIGYDTCHRTKEYDATKCYKDCQVKEAKFSFIPSFFQISSETGKK